MDLSVLNDRQREAVECLEGPLLVLAGAGSGKTKVLTYRIANLVEHGVKPWNILALTFTNKAAQEMRERASALIGSDADEAWVTTFHSCCVRILRIDCDKIGYERSFTIYDDADQLKIIGDILKNMGISDKAAPKRVIKENISNAKNKSLDVKRYIQENYSGVSDGSAVTKAPYVALDITDKDAVEKVITEVNPDAVIHCAAWTAVDMAEDDDKVAKVRAINAGGTQNIANICKKLDCKMTYISTDYVFDGQGTEPWQPDCKDYKPLNVYGQTKLEGELAVSQTLDKYFIVRIAWVFGLNGKNFIKTMLNVGKTHDIVRVVNDQIGTPTYTYDLARLLVDMNETEKYGYYHATNEGGYISWYDFTKEIYRQAGYKTEVLPVTTAEYGLSKAARPFNSRLDKSKLVEAGFTPLPTWQDALSRYLKEIEQ